jgi:hypothetical protein
MGIYETLKSIANAFREADKIEQYRQINEAMAKLKEMENQLTEFEKENKLLKEKLKIKDDLTVSNDAYWLKSNKDGPFCKGCWDDNNKLIRLKDDYECPVCKTKYGPKKPARIISL